MRIESIKIKGFGCLTGRSYEFPRDKAVLVLEDNETGKSTLASAILAGLCGFPSRKGEGEKMKLAEIYRPWNGVDYAVEMVIEADGSRWLIERNFSKKGFVIRDADTNRDMSAKFDPDLAKHFLHLPREDFSRIAFVTGKEVNRFDSSANLRSRLAAVIEGTQDDSGADNAIAALSAPRYSIDGASPVLIDTAIKRLSDSLADKRRDMSRLEASLDSAGEQARKLDESRARHAELTARLESLDEEYKSARQAEARERIRQVEQLRESARDLDKEAGDIQSQLNETKQFAVASDRDPVDIAAARQALQSAEETLNRISTDAKIEGTGAAGYAAAAIGSMGALISIGLMIAGRIDTPLSVTGVVVGALIAGLGLVHVLHSGGQKNGLKARLEQAQDMLDETRRQAVKKLSLFSVECGQHADAVELLARTSEKISIYLANRAKLREIREKLTIIERNITEISAKIEHESRFINQANGGHVSERSADEVESERQLARSRLNDAIAEMRRLDGEVGAIVHEYRRDYPALEESARNLKRELEKAERFKLATKLAHDVLREVSEQSRGRWAVALNEQAGIILPRLNPCYGDIRFDDSLDFTVRRVEDNRIVEKNEIDSRLSTGAKDQVYLAVRLAICRELSRAGESVPIILDDPLIAADDTRFELGFRYLVEELSKNQQVIILSCHRGRHEELSKSDWFKQNAVALDL